MPLANFLVYSLQPCVINKKTKRKFTKWTSNNTGRRHLKLFIPTPRNILKNGVFAYFVAPFRQALSLNVVQTTPSICDLLNQTDSHYQEREKDFTRLFLIIQA